MGMKKASWGNHFDADMSDLIGRTFTSIVGAVDANEVTLVCDEGAFVFYHENECCEHVRVQDITGDLNDLVGNPILLSEKATSGEDQGYVPGKYNDSHTWTFYKLATIKGYVDIRWLGESNGYYSENVSLEFIPNQTEGVGA
jgi:hypothetical protein